MNKYIAVMGAATVLFAVLLFGVAYGQFEGESDSILTKWLKTISGQTDKQTAVQLMINVGPHYYNHDVYFYHLYDNNRDYSRITEYCQHNITKNYCTVAKDHLAHSTNSRLFIFGLDDYNERFEVYLRNEVNSCHEYDVIITSPTGETREVGFHENHCDVSIYPHERKAGVWTWHVKQFPELKGKFHVIDASVILWEYLPHL